MALIDLALRLCAVRALRGATYAEDRVYDSEIAPLDQRVDKERAPVISIYTDASRISEGKGRDILNASRQVDMTIDIAASTPILRDDALYMPATDAALEAQINLIMRQIVRALWGDQSNEWADIWRSLWVRMIRSEETRGAQSEGLRFAARQVVLSLEVISEPPFQNVSGVWLRLLSAMRQSGETGLVQLADIIETEIQTPGLADWRVAQSDLGLTRQAWIATGLSNIGAEPPEFDQDTFDDLSDGVELS